MAQIKQDMPPPGGYEPLVWQRIPLKPGLPVPVKIGLGFGVMAAGFLVYKYTRDQMNLEKIEMRCSRIALEPLLLAESDRQILKQLKKNRDYEEKLMKDVPGWEVGKWFNYPVYLTFGPDEFFKPHRSEYYAHTNSKIHQKWEFLHRLY